MSRPIRLISQEDEEAAIHALSVKRKADLRLCKDRALEYVDMGDPKNAFASFVSDTQKTWSADKPCIDWTQLTYILLLGVGQKWAAEHDTVQMRNWIEGFS